MPKKLRKPRDPQTYNIQAFVEKLPPDHEPGTKTVAVPIRLDPEVAERLAAMTPSRSYHARQAVEGYLQEFEKLQAIADALGLLPGEAIAYCIRQVAAPPPSF